MGDQIETFCFYIFANKSEIKEILKSIKEEFPNCDEAAIKNLIQSIKSNLTQEEKNKLKHELNNLNSLIYKKESINNNYTQEEVISRIDKYYNSRNELVEYLEGYV